MKRLNLLILLTFSLILTSCGKDTDLQLSGSASNSGGGSNGGTASCSNPQIYCRTEFPRPTTASPTRTVEARFCLANRLVLTSAQRAWDVAVTDSVHGSFGFQAYSTPRANDLWFTYSAGAAAATHAADVVFVIENWILTSARNHGSLRGILIYLPKYSYKIEFACKVASF